MTVNTYRRKALPHLQKDFENRCAYCLRPMIEEHPNQSHVEHFDAHLPTRQKNRYKNLMLGCSTCNLVKGYKDVVDRVAPERGLLNCTIENEFPEHIVEEPNTCQWGPRTPAGDYHIQALDLNQPAHVRRRARRRETAERVEALHAATLVNYRGKPNSVAFAELKRTMEVLANQIKDCIPFPTESGLQPPPKLVRI